MGRIADAANDDDADGLTFTNKVDTVLERLDDDADRAVVLSWLFDPDVGDEEVELRLLAHGIRCSDSTIRRWRVFQARGMGRPWVA